MNDFCEKPSNDFTELIDELSTRRYAVVERAVSSSLMSQLRLDFASRSSDFRPAKVGRSGHASDQPAVRNDEICWINDGDLREGEAALFEIFDSLRKRLNRELFLGLTDFEAHYARYDIGHFYSSHVDTFKTDGARVISVVLYLNPDWSDADGGELRLHTSPPLDIRPAEGTLVCFTSADIVHEVLPAQRARMSIAAWFRRSAS